MSTPVVRPPSEPGTLIPKLGSMLFIVFCTELGLFLAIYPWTNRWNVNLIPALLPSAQLFWLNGYFRGVVSGLGLLNLWIAFTEIFRLRRFYPQRQS